MSSDRVLVDPAATHDLGLRLVRAARTLDRLLPELTSLADQVECSAAPTRLAQVREAARATGSDLTWLADEVVRADGGGEFTVPGGDLRTARLDAQRAEWCPDEQVSPRNHLGEFFGGAIDSIRATGDQINALTFDLFFDPQQWATNWNDVGNAALHSVTNPGDLYHAVVDPELFWENPARWAGSFAPDAIGVALGGSSVAARTTRSLDRVDLPDLPDIPAPHGVDTWLPPPGSVGAMRARTYEASPKHHPNARGPVSKAPTNGQAALDYSVGISPTTSRRVGIDYATGDFVVFDETLPGVFHGHVRSWEDLTQQMQNTLYRAGMVNRRGAIQ